MTAILPQLPKLYAAPRRSQERLIATPLLERLSVACGGVDAVERQLLTLLDAWRNQPLAEQGYGPGNVVNLLRLFRGHLRGLDLARLAIRQAYLQGVAVQDTSLAGVTIQDSIFTETFDAITAVAVSSTGAYWAAASTRGEVRIWAAGAQARYRMWRAHTDMVWALAFSPDGHTLASGSWDGTVKLWDAGSGALRWSGRHTSHINSVAFAPDGNILASSGNDATVRLWDLRSGAQLQVLPHPAQVSVVTWSPDGRLFATGDVVGSIRLWELPQIGPAICVQTLTGHANWVDGLAFAPDGSTLASASWDGTVKLWDTSTHRSGLWPRGHPSSGDTSGQAAHNANVVGESLRQTLAGHTDQVSRVAWSPDGCILASSSRDQTIRLWDIESSSYRAALVGHSAGVKGLAFTPNSRSLLSGSEDGTLRVWDVASGQCIRVVQGYAASLYDLDWSPDGAQMVSGGSDTLVTIYDATGGTPPRVLRGHSGVVLGVGWSSDRRWLASSEWENTIRLWDPVSGASLQVLRHPDDPGNYFYGLAWSPDGQRLASATYRRGLQVFEFTAQHQRWAEREFPTWIRPVAWSPDGQQLAGGGDDGTLYVWDATDGTLVEQLAGHHSMITSVAWSPAGTRLASGSGGSAGGELFVWDTQRGERLRAFAGHPGTIYAVAWGSSEDVLISGGGNGNLRWWDVQSGECVWVRQAHQGTVQALRRSPDGSRLASCGDDGAIMLWNLRTGEQLQTLRRDGPYERMDITGLRGLTKAQRASLIALGAVDATGEQRHVPGDKAESIATASLPADAGQPTGRDRKVALGLPFQPTPFIGRDAELSEIARLLGDPACRLLTLLGPGGIGKTRLALAVAGHQTAAFADGVAFVALASVSMPNQIVSAIGETLGLAFTGQPDPTAPLLSYLRARQMLLVLDNVEHLLAGAELISAILARAPRVTILITSRERLNLQAEWLFDVQGLAYPPEDQHGQQSPEDLTEYSAIQLFVQRATQVQPKLSLSASALTTIVRICQHVAGMPLAIELAAAGVRTLSLTEIERQIRANLDVLATTRRDVPIRHRSMRAVFEHSWRLLSESEQALFSRLAVFRGGFSREAAEAVCLEGKRQKAKGKKEDGDAPLLPFTFCLLPLLTALVDKSLVRQDSAEKRSSVERDALNAGAEPRFVLLEPIREYALEQLVARGEALALQRAHASYYLALAEAAAAQWDTPMAEAMIKQLDREHDNLRAALRWVCDGGDHTIGLRLAGALRKFWQSRGLISEGRAWLAVLLARADTTVDAAGMVARLNATQAAAWLASNQHDFAHAGQLFEQSITLQRALGEIAGETQLLFNTALQARAAGHYHQAITLLEEAVTQHRARGDRGSLSAGGLGLALYGLGLMCREQGEFARAATLFEECIDLHRALGDREGTAQSLLALGDIARDQGNVALMRTYGEQSLGVFRELGVQWAIGFALNNLALAASLEGELAHAFTLVEESVSLFRSLHADGSLAEVLITRGQIVQAQGARVAAQAALTEALQLAWAVGPRLLVAAALEGLASVVVAQGHAELAAYLLAAASTLRVQMGTPVRPVDQAGVEQTLATARSTLGDDAFAAVWAEAQALPIEQILSTIPSVAAFAVLGDRLGRYSEPTPAVDWSDDRR